MLLCVWTPSRQYCCSSSQLQVPVPVRRAVIPVDQLKAARAGPHSCPGLQPSVDERFHQDSPDDENVNLRLKYSTVVDVVPATEHSFILYRTVSTHPVRRC